MRAVVGVKVAIGAASPPAQLSVRLVEVDLGTSVGALDRSYQSAEPSANSAFHSARASARHSCLGKRMPVTRARRRKRVLRSSRVHWGEMHRSVP